MAKGKLWIILLIAAILLAASVVVYMKKTQPLEDLTQRYDYLTRLTHSGDNRGTAWSPDGSKIFFRRSDISFQNSGIERGKSHIYVMNSDGSNQTQLAEGMGIALSPDGSKVFFYREKLSGEKLEIASSPGLIVSLPSGEKPEDKGWELWVMNADGSNLQKLSEVNADSIEDLRNPESFIMPHSWSPDRAKIIFYTTKRVISDYPWIQHEDGILERGEEGHNFTGDYSICNPYSEIVSTLWMWNVEGGWGKARKIISSKSLPEAFVLQHISIAWNPDGKSFIFSFLDIVEGSIHAPIYNATVAYDEREMLTSIQGGVTDIALSPDGKNILYSHRIGQSITTVGGDIWVMNVDGSGRRQLTNNLGSMGEIWSPDGKRIAYRSYSGDFGWFGDQKKNYEDSSEIWIMNADGSDKQLLLSIPFPYGVIWSDLHWSPDGSKLAFGWTPNQQFTRSDIYLIDVPEI
ncbi:MAG: hypothetical protein Q8M95_12370 [Candidatus Methanoperedens sp.]|nr:hypothetical protein [Candidatus Methanoperedens sp.]